MANYSLVERHNYAKYYDARYHNTLYVIYQRWRIEEKISSLTTPTIPMFIFAIGNNRKRRIHNIQVFAYKNNASDNVIKRV